MDSSKEKVLDVVKLQNDLLASLGERKDVLVQHHSLSYQCGNYDFLKIVSNDIRPGDKVILIRASIHGDEIAGFYTMLYHLNQIFDYAHKKGVKLIVYPLANPSGFERNIRYNADGDKGDYVNNHFLQYELTDGRFVKDIEESNEYAKWYWASDPVLKIHLAEETKLMHQLLKNDPLTQIEGVVDLHQDYFTEGVESATYQYAYDDLGRYGDIVKKIREIISVLSNYDIGAGFETSMVSDENGFIVRNDGSLPDLFHRMGCPHCITPETTGKTPLELACKVNLLWILGVIDLV